MNSTLSTAQDAVTDAAGAVSDALSAGVELVDDVTPDLVDAVEAAVDTVASTSKFTIRLASKVVRFVARRPKEVLIGIALIAVVAGAVSYLSQRSSDANA